MPRDSHNTMAMTTPRGGAGGSGTGGGGGGGGSQVQMVVGDTYWIASKTDAVWRLVELVAKDEVGPGVTVRYADDGATDSTVLQFQLLGADDRDVGDMTELHHIHEATILHTLERRSRLEDQRPYTNMASVLVAVNPLRWLEAPDPERDIGAVALYPSIACPTSGCPMAS